MQSALIVQSPARRKLREGERIGLVVTEAGWSYKKNVVPRAVQELTGVRHGVAVGVWFNRDDLQRRLGIALAARLVSTPLPPIRRSFVRRHEGCRP